MRVRGGRWAAAAAVGVAVWAGVATPAWADCEPGDDHSKPHTEQAAGDHSSMPGMDHATPMPSSDHATPMPGMDHGTPMPGMDHSTPMPGMDHGSGGDHAADEGHGTVAAPVSAPSDTERTVVLSAFGGVNALVMAAAWVLRRRGRPRKERRDAARAASLSRADEGGVQ